MVRRDQQPGDADYYDVSFSGLKTAVLQRGEGRRTPTIRRARSRARFRTR